LPVLTRFVFLSHHFLLRHRQLNFHFRHDLVSKLVAKAFRCQSGGRVLFQESVLVLLQNEVLKNEVVISYLFKYFSPADESVLRADTLQESFKFSLPLIGVVSVLNVLEHFSSQLFR
jgi:hypothetical protein